MYSALLLIGLAAVPATFTVHADSVSYDGKRKLTDARGNAKFRATGVALDAKHLSYDELSSTLTATGDVVGRVVQPGMLVVVGEEIRIRFEGEQISEIWLPNAKALGKSKVAPSALLGASTRTEAESIGTSMALVTAHHLVREKKGWRADGVTIVPCDCDVLKPSWGISAARAHIDFDAKRVSAASAIVRVRKVPIFWIPWLSLPLEERQTGLLFIKPSYTQLNGFGIEVPVYLTLGRSMDLTLTPGYVTGGPQVSAYGIAGPRLTTEFRYVPSETARGRVQVGLLYDLRQQRDPLEPTATNGKQRGLRGEFSWQHFQDWGASLGTRLDVNAYSDGYFNRDLTTDVVAATSSVLNSSATLFYRRDDFLLTLDVALGQDLRNGYSWLGTGPAVANSTSPHFARGTLQRLPAITATVPWKDLWGPLRFDASGSYVRLAPLFSLTGDEGVGANEGSTYAGTTELSWSCINQRLGGAGTAGCAIPIDRSGVGDRRYQEGEREARDRFTGFPRLGAFGTLGSAVNLSSWVGWRESLWIGEASGRFWQRGALVIDGVAESEIARSFGSWRHSITPAVALRSIPVQEVTTTNPSGGSPVPYDAVDGADGVLLGPRVQVATELRQRVSDSARGIKFQLDLGQGFYLVSPEVVAPTLGETYGKFGFSWNWYRVDAQARLDPILGRLTRGAISGSIDDGRGHSLWVRYDNILSDGTDRTRAPLDLLFGAPVPASSTSRAESLTAGANWKFGVFGLRYEILLNATDWDGANGRPSNPVLSLAQHTLSVAFTPACNCWRIDLYARQGLDATSPTRPKLAVPDVGLLLNIAGLGTIGGASGGR